MDAIILAGGASRRMGREKAAIVVDGVTLLERAIQAVRKAGAQRIAVVGLAATSAIRTDSLPGFVRLVPDTQVGLGPLSGIIAGLTFLRDQRQHGDDDRACIVVACDHPELDPTELGDLAARLSMEQTDTLVVLPVTEGQRQPLHAAYRLRAVEPLEKAFREGERSLLRVLEALAQTPPNPTRGPPVLLLDRGEGHSHRSYVDLDDQVQLQTYLDGIVPSGGKTSLDDCTSG